MSEPHTHTRELENRELEIKYQDTVSPELSFIEWALIYAFSFTLWFGPIFGWFLIADSVIITLMCCLMVPVVLIVVNVILKSMIDNAFFKNEDNHTHDTDCGTCGSSLIFGNHSDNRRNNDYVCRYKTGEIHNKYYPTS